MTDQNRKTRPERHGCRARAHLGAVFPDAAHARAAADALSTMGIGAPSPDNSADDDVWFEHRATSRFSRELGIGTAVGAGIGLVAGLGFAAAAVTGIGAGGILVVGAGAGFFGATLGALTGSVLGGTSDITHEELTLPRRRPGEILVIVCDHGHGDEVRSVMTDHAGSLVELVSPTLS